MNEEFSRQKLVDNITALMQQKKLKVGEVEQEIGISTGYLSKMLKKETEAAPSTDIIWKLAKVLGVSTDMLIEGDFSQATDNLQYMGNFFTRLKVMTDANDLEWQRISIADINDQLKSENPHLPIIKTVNSDKVMVSVIPAFYEGREVSASGEGKNRIHSVGVDVDRAWVTNTAFHTCFDGATDIFIFPMGCEFRVDEAGNTVDDEYFDFYFGHYREPEDYTGGYELPQEAYEYVYEPVCNTFNIAQSLSGVARALYQSIARHEYDLKISSSVRSTIANFMNPPAAFDPDNLPF